MRLIEIDGRMMLNRIQSMEYITELFGFNEYFGKNLDALYDYLGDICEPTDILIYNENVMLQNLGTYGTKLLLVLNNATTENKMLQVINYEGLDTSVPFIKSKEKNREVRKNSMETIDAYILQYTPEVQEILQAIRKVIKEAAPTAQETISYQMPTFVLHGNLVHFAAFKNHIGFYPAPSGIEAFKNELSGYKGAKGSVQFPIEKPMPFDLIRDIVQFRVIENINLAEVKQKKKK